MYDASRWEHFNVWPLLFVFTFVAFLAWLPNRNKLSAKSWECRNGPHWIVIWPRHAVTLHLCHTFPPAGLNELRRRKRALGTTQFSFPCGVEGWDRSSWKNCESILICVFRRGSFVCVWTSFKPVARGGSFLPIPSFKTNRLELMHSSDVLWNGYCRFPPVHVTVLTHDAILETFTTISLSLC